MEVMDTEVMGMEVMDMELMGTEVMDMELMGTEVMGMEVMGMEVMGMEVMGRQGVRTEGVGTERAWVQRSCGDSARMGAWAQGARSSCEQLQARRALACSSRRGEHALVYRRLKLQILLLQIAESLFVALKSLLHVLSHEPRLLVRRSDRRQERREDGTRLCGRGHVGHSELLPRARARLHSRGAGCRRYVLPHLVALQIILRGLRPVSFQSVLR